MQLRNNIDIYRNRDKNGGIKMATIVYGTHVFTKMTGYYGTREECSVCHKAYPKAFVKNTVWAHFEYIPLFPIKKTYFRMCPICGCGDSLKNKEAKEVMLNYGKAVDQNLVVYAKHYLANKPKGIMSTDSSYEVLVKDISTGEEYCIAPETTKATVKEIKKARGLKKIEITDIQ